MELTDSGISLNYKYDLWVLKIKTYIKPVIDIRGN